MAVLVTCQVLHGSSVTRIRLVTADGRELERGSEAVSIVPALGQAQERESRRSLQFREPTWGPLTLHLSEEARIQGQPLHAPQCNVNSVDTGPGAWSLIEVHKPSVLVSASYPCLRLRNNGGRCLSMRGAQRRVNLWILLLVCAGPSCTTQSTHSSDAFLKVAQAVARASRSDCPPSRRQDEIGLHSPLRL